MKTLDVQLLPIDKFPSQAKYWDQLNNDSFNSPLLNSAFVSLLIKYFSDGSETLVIARTGNSPILMAIIKNNNLFSWQTFQPSQGPVGLWLADKSIDIADVCETIIKKLPGFPLIFGILQQDPSLSPRPSNKGKLHTLDYIKTARITVEGSFDEYWSKRGKNLRQNLRKQRNRLKRDGIKTRLDILKDPTNVASALTEYGRMESSGWKDSKGTAVTADNTQGQFYRELLETYCSRNEGYIFCYLLDDEIVAIDLCISHNRSIVILKTTYNESYKNISPAFLMREELFRYFFDENMFDAIEFYGRVMEWHTRWTQEIRTMYHVNCMRWATLSSIKKWFAKD